MNKILELNDLSVTFDTNYGPVTAVENINLDVGAGEILAVVGESGSGKSQSFLATMGLLSKNGRTSGEAVFEGQDLLRLPMDKLDRIRGNRVAMIFQDPMTALNPTLRLSTQLVEPLMVHQGKSRKEAETIALEMLELVRISDAERRFRQYPHELSGGMRQRVMIAMALLCKPALLIADEPTTALDVTIQSQVLDIFKDIREKLGTAIILVTHDLGVVADIADRAIVMYAGRAMEFASSEALFDKPGHPYTRALIASTPRPDMSLEALSPIEGRPPAPDARPDGCLFAPRCAFFKPGLCDRERPSLRSYNGTQLTACVRAEDVEAEIAAKSAGDR